MMSASKTLAARKQVGSRGGGGGGNVKARRPTEKTAQDDWH